LHVAGCIPWNNAIIIFVIPKMTNVITRRRPRVDEEEDVVEEWERIYQLAVARKVRDPKLVTVNPKL